MTIVMAMVILAGILSCNNETKSKALNTKEDCIILNRYQIKPWLQTGWQDNTSPNYIPRLYFEPSTAMFSPIFITAYPQLKNLSINPTKIANCTIASVDPPCNFGLGKYATQLYNYLLNGFYDAKTKDLIQFDYIRLVPATHNVGGIDYLCFNVFTVTGGTATPRSHTWPCPPYCCPDNCPTDQ